MCSDRTIKPRPSPPLCWQIHRCLAVPVPTSRLWVHCPRASDGLLPPRLYLVGYVRWDARSDPSSLSDNHSNSFQVAIRIARHPFNERQPTPLEKKITETVSNVLSAFVICNAKDAGWLERPFQLSSAFEDSEIPLRGLVEHFEGLPVQVTIIRG